MSKQVVEKVRFLGRKTDFKGKSLWEIVSNLSDRGVGRMVIRNMFQRYQEPCFMRILKVEEVEPPKNPAEARKVKVTVEKTWRGVTLPKPITIYSTSYKADYELVEPQDEAKFLQNSKKVQEQILPNQLELPPLLREFVQKETGVENPMMRVHFKKSANKFARLAVGDEKPTVELTMGLGTPCSPKLYEGLLGGADNKNNNEEKHAN